MAHSSGGCKSKTRQSHLEGPVLHRHMDEEGKSKGLYVEGTDTRGDLILNSHSHRHGQEELQRESS